MREKWWSFMIGENPEPVMKPVLSTILMVSALILVLPAAPAAAGAVEKACISTKNKSATYRRCACIENAAKSTLTFSERRKAAKIIRKPELSDELKLSKSAGDKAFWKVYARFAKRAEGQCR